MDFIKETPENIEELKKKANKKTSWETRSEVANK